MTAALTALVPRIHLLAELSDEDVEALWDAIHTCSDTGCRYGHPIAYHLYDYEKTAWALSVIGQGRVEEDFNT